MARPRRATAPAPPALAAAATMTPEAIQQEIANGFNAVLVEQAASQTRNGGAGVQAAPAAHRCTYKDFMACQSTCFKGAEGVTELAQLIEVKLSSKEAVALRTTKLLLL